MGDWTLQKVVLEGISHAGNHNVAPDCNAMVEPIGSAAEEVRVA